MKSRTHEIDANVNPYALPAPLPAPYNRSQGETPCPDETRPTGQHLGYLGHSNAVGGDIDNGLGAATGVVTVLVLMAGISFFSTIAAIVFYYAIH
jgi:hypothetical protein